MTIGIIGGGNMGTALAQAFLKKDLVSRMDLMIGNEAGKNAALLSQDVLIIAVKPQQFDELAKEISGRISEKTIVISIMAGVPIKKISDLLHHEKIVRSMPNTPALVNQGVVGWFGQISPEEKNIVQNILSVVGFTFEVSDEVLLNDVTALSGCGPGFFYSLVASWFAATEQFKLPAQTRHLMLLKTLEGSLALLEASHKTPFELQTQVASKGGATEAGLKVLKSAQLESLFAKMLKAAYTRCQELAKQ